MPRIEPGAAGWEASMLTLSYAAKFELFVAHGKEKRNLCQELRSEFRKSRRQFRKLRLTAAKSRNRISSIFSFHQDARLSIFIVDVDKVEPLTIRAWRNSLLKEITHVRPTYVFRQRCFCLSFYQSYWSMNNIFKTTVALRNADKSSR